MAKKQIERAKGIQTQKRCTDCGAPIVSPEALAKQAIEELIAAGRMLKDQHGRLWVVDPKDRRATLCPNLVV